MDFKIDVSLLWSDDLSSSGGLLVAGVFQSAASKHKAVERKVADFHFSGTSVPLPCGVSLVHVSVSGDV